MIVYVYLLYGFHHGTGFVHHLGLLCHFKFSKLETSISIFWVQNLENLCLQNLYYYFFGKFVTQKLRQKTNSIIYRHHTN
jgi:hypothetical protein